MAPLRDAGPAGRPPVASQAIGPGRRTGVNDGPAPPTIRSPVPVWISSRPAAPVTVTSAEPALVITCVPTGA
ncbi:hypothetical protein AB0G02_31090, partial [Actinosynnema sp. NPDC023658]|uniref:hypothetical protein n=1 Tax=Actinosynnema sp. NPDC023658 TaxID=3155465 RepID=UPI0034109CB5